MRLHTKENCPVQTTFILLFALIVLLLTVTVTRADIRFIPNHGQWKNESKFRAEIPGGHLYVFNDRLLYHFFSANASGHHHDEMPRSSSRIATTNKTRLQSDSIHNHSVVEVLFSGGAVPQISASEPSEDVYNYFYGSDPDKWVSKLHSYGGLALTNLYPGISLRLYFKNGALKYDWEILPGADPTYIQMEYRGADEIKIAEEKLIVTTLDGAVTEDAPVAYTGQEGLKKDVPCSFSLNGRRLSFLLPEQYDRTQKLTIDPELVFSSYSGSYANNWGNTATYDSQGNLYTGGIAFEPGFPINSSTGAEFPQEYHLGIYDGEYYNGSSDVVIMKFSQDGKKRLYSTYLGGSYQETPHSMIVNDIGELIVMGSTSSSNFPVRNGFDAIFNGGVVFDPFGYAYGSDNPADNNPFALYQKGSDIFVVKFSSNGSTLVAGSFLGGSGNDGILEMTNPLCRNYGDQFRGEVNLDLDGNILLAGVSSSSDFPVNKGRPYSYGITDGVAVKLTSDLSTILWSTYIGGSSQDAAFGVCTDKEGNVFVTGGTNSQDFQKVLATSSYGGDGDGFIQKYSSTGNLLSSRYINGTSFYDQSYLIQSDTSGNVYVYGQTKGNIVISSGVYFNKNACQFIQKYSNDLSNLIWSTVVGSGNADFVVGPDISPTAFLVSDCGTIYLAGWGGGYNNETSYYTPGQRRNVLQRNYYVGGYTYNMPISGIQKAYQSSTDGSDFYIMVLSRDASSLVYATYFGGPDTKDHVDGGTSRFDKQGNIYECVCACFSKADYPTTPGVVSRTNNSIYDGNYKCNNAAFKFDLGHLKASFDTYSASHQGPGFNKGCKPLQIDLVNTSQGGITYNWTFGDGKNFAGFAPPNHMYNDTGTFKVVLKATNLATCLQVDSAVQFITVGGFDLSVKPDTICIDSSGSLTAIAVKPGNKAYAWYLNYKLVSSDSSIVLSPSEDQTYLVVVYDSVQRCWERDSVSLHVVNIKASASSGLDNDCDGKTEVVFKNSMKDSGSVLWDFGDGTSSAEQQPVHPYAPGSYTVHLTTSDWQCRFDTAFQVKVEKLFVPNLFTPNNDSENAKFEVKGIQGDWKLEVYNRWGAPVYENKAYNNEWAGRHSSDGLYYYLLSSPFGKKCRGWVEIVR